MVMYLVSDQPPNAGDSIKYRYPFIASEVLSDESTQIRNVLMTEQCMNLLFNFIEKPGHIPSLYAHHICRVFHSLFCHNGEKVYIYLF